MTFSKAVQNSKTALSDLWKQTIKPLLRQMRHTLAAQKSHELIKPISWQNSLYWVHRTLKTDQKHYQAENRPISIQRLSSFFKPNLEKPVFIVGSPRSGTTFLGNCINMLPEISYHFEPVITKAAARYIYTGDWKFSQGAKFYRITYAWLMRLHLNTDLRFVEKTPQISFIIPFLAQAFPDAKFIHIIRDGRDVALSLAEKPWHRSDQQGSTNRDPDGYLCGPWARFWVEPERVEEFETTNDLHRCIWIWRRHVEAVMQAFEKLPNQRCYELKYENLVLNPIQESKKLLDFLDIVDPQSRQLFQDTVSSKSKTDSIERWKSILSSTDLDQLHQEAGHLIRQLGHPI